MYTRWIDYYEDYSRSHDDKFTENLSTDDFLLKGKYNFLGKTLKLSGKTKLNTTKDGRLASSADYSITHNLSPVSSYMVTHKPDSVTLDGNFKLYQQDKILLTLYANSKLEQNENKRELPTKMQLRFHHEDNKIISFGFEQLDPFKSASPKVLSTWGLFGGNLPNKFRFYAGAHTGFHLHNKTLLFHKYLVALKHRDVNGSLEFGIAQVPHKTKNAEGVEVDTFTNHRAIAFKVNGLPVDKVKVGGDLHFNFDTKKLSTKVFGEYAVDALTNVKAKFENDHSLTLGINHNYKGLINFGFVSRVIL